MARKGYWIKEFCTAVPHFLTEWYLRDFAEEDCNEVFRVTGVDLAIEAGSLKVEDIGKVVAQKIDAIGTIMTFFENSKDPIVKEMFRQWENSFNISAHKRNALAYALYRPLGEYVKNTVWWEENEKALRKRANDFIRTKRVMES